MEAFVNRVFITLAIWIPQDGTARAEKGGRSIERAGSINDVGIGWGARAYKRVYS